MQKAHDATKNDYWRNYPDLTTPIIAEQLNRIESNLDVIDDRVVTFDTTKANQSDMLTVFYDVTLDEETGIFTFYRKNGTTVTIDTLLEKIITNWYFDNDPTSAHYQQMVLTLKDGTVQYIDLSAFITQFEFIDSSTIHWVVNNNGEVVADIINGSITEAKLQPNFLADCRAQASAATQSAQNSEAWAVGTKDGTPVSSGTDQYNNHSKYYSGVSKSNSEDSEAWAKGQRNGIDIPSTDPAFHNNAYYWALQARAIVGNKVDTFNGRFGTVEPEKGDYSMDMIVPPDGSSNGMIPVVRNVGTTQTEWAFVMEDYQGAHKILDEQGSQLTQRENLQFTGNVELSDNSDTGRSVVNIPEYTPERLGSGYAECDTAAATVAKVATLADYQLVVNGIVAVKFTYDVPANSTLNVNNQGAKPMYYQGAAIVADIIKAGDTATFMYSDSERYEVISIDRGGSSGSSGHTIKDGDGSVMPTQPNLQFADANVSNDGTNNATVIHNFVDIDWDDWQEVDDNDDTYYRVKDAPLVDGNVEIDLMKKLWENPAPTASFVAQTVTLNSADYDFLLGIYKVDIASSSPCVDSTVIIKGQSGLFSSSIGTSTLWRSVNYVSDTSYSLAGGYADGSTDDRKCVPVAIYGIKQKVSISLSAIISNVSTSAENCMMPDGETSVADAITWKLAGSGTSVSVDTVFNNAREFLLLASYTPSGNDWTYTFNVPQIALTDNKRFFNGYGYQSSTNLCNIPFTKSTNTFTLTEMKVDNNDRTSASTLKVYYR